MTDLTSHYYEDLHVGMQAELSNTVSEQSIIEFAKISGDNNPLHLDEEYAKHNRFGARIAHGMLSASFISAVLGTKLPGPGSIYLNQTLTFKAPVKIGDTVVTRATVKEKVLGKPRVILETTCHVGATLVTTGEAVMLVPKKF